MAETIMFTTHLTRGKCRGISQLPTFEKYHQIYPICHEFVMAFRSFRIAELGLTMEIHADNLRAVHLEKSDGKVRNAQCRGVTRISHSIYSEITTSGVNDESRLLETF